MPQEYFKKDSVAKRFASRNVVDDKKKAQSTLEGDTQKSPDGLTVADLIASLQTMPQEAIVVFGYQSGDYWRTQLAKGVKNVELKKVQYSGYHEMHTIKDIDEDNGDENGNETEGTEVVVLE